MVYRLNALPEPEPAGTQESGGSRMILVLTDSGDYQKLCGRRLLRLDAGSGEVVVQHPHPRERVLRLLSRPHRHSGGPGRRTGSVTSPIRTGKERTGAGFSAIISSENARRNRSWNGLTD